MSATAKTYLAPILSLLLLLTLSARDARGLEQAPLRRVAIIPFSRALIKGTMVDVTEMVRARLQEMGIEVVDRDLLEGYLADKRIRRAKFLDRPSVILLGDKLNADALVLGFADLMMSGDTPVATVNVQFVDCNEVKVIWAKTVSHSGEDSETILGLGRIDDPVELTRQVVGELLQSLPKYVPAIPTEIHPFVVSRAVFEQKFVHGGQKVRFEVDVRSIVGQVAHVRAVFRNETIELERKALELYTGMLIAPAEESEYGVNLVVEDERGRKYPFEEVAFLQVHNTPPGLKVVPRQVGFSPNADGFLDAAFFAPIIEKTIDLRGWSYEVRDAEGVVAYRRKGIGAPPETIVWSGLDGSMNKVPDGFYAFWIEVTDIAGNRSEIEPLEFTLDTAPPAITLELQQEPDKTLLKLSCDEISPMAYWEITLKDSSGKEIRRFNGLDVVPETLDVTAALPPEAVAQSIPLRFDLVARDVLGNGVRSLDKKVEIPSEREKEKEKKIWIEGF